MSRILIAYATHFGQTKKIAETMRAQLRAAGHEAEIADLSQEIRNLPPPEDYDVVVLGSRVESGTHARPLLAYIRAHRDALTSMPTAMFSVSNSAARPGASADPEDYLAKLNATTQWRPTLQVAFGGGLPYRAYSWWLRFIMKSISRREGAPTDTSKNHDLTNWDAVRRFATRIEALCPRVDGRVATRG